MPVSPALMFVLKTGRCDGEILFDSRLLLLFVSGERLRQARDILQVRDQSHESLIGLRNGSSVTKR
jgi:hypothetical protein